MSFYADNRAELETLTPLLRRIASGEATEEEKQQALASPMASQFGVADQIRQSEILTRVEKALGEMEAEG